MWSTSTCFCFSRSEESRVGSDWSSGVCSSDLLHPRLALRSVPWSCQFIGLEFLPGTVADVEHVDLLLLLHDAVDYAVHVRLVAKEQVSEVTVFWRHRAAVGAASQGANGVPEAAIPGKSRIRRTCINPVIEAGKIPLCGGMILIRYAMGGFGMLRRTPRRRGLVLAWTAPRPGGCLRECRRGLRYRAAWTMASALPFTVSTTGRLLFLRCFIKSPDRRRNVVSD